MSIYINVCVVYSIEDYFDINGHQRRYTYMVFAFVCRRRPLCDSQEFFFSQTNLGLCVVADVASSSLSVNANSHSAVVVDRIFRTSV